jgi:hypothetical protein
VAHFSSGFGVELSCISTRRFCSFIENERGGSSPAKLRVVTLQPRGRDNATIFEESLWPGAPWLV